MKKVNSFRPANWQEIRQKYIRAVIMDVNIDNREHPERAYFEAGADAFLEALFKLAEESPTGTFTIDSRSTNIYGELMRTSGTVRTIRVEEKGKKPSRKNN